MEYIFPLKQHIGAPAMAIVKTGDTVLRGQKIAVKPLQAMGSNIFSSIKGYVTVADEEKIVIEEFATDYSDYEKLTGTTSEELIEESGIVGLGGAGFPTYVKLQAKLSKEGTVIINAAECEPVLSHNIKRIEEEPEKLLEALEILLQIMHVSRGIIAIKEIHAKAINQLRDADSNYKFEIKELEDIYPMGEERAIIRETLGILLPTDALPSQADAVVVNAETAFRIREAVKEKKPFIDKDVTVAGKLKENGSIHVLFDVPLGKKVEDVLEMAGGLSESYGELIMGGPFTGKRTNLKAPVIKTTGGIIAAEEFLKGPDKIGLLVCACGADSERLKEQAESMKSKVVGIEYCKQACKKGNALKCENPGHCPGQVGKIINLKKAGAKAVLISNCSDCSNTVMSCAPKMGLTVYHCTDGALRAVNHQLIRRLCQ